MLHNTTSFSLKQRKDNIAQTKLKVNTFELDSSDDNFENDDLDREKMTYSKTGGPSIQVKTKRVKKVKSKVSKNDVYEKQ